MRNPKQVVGDVEALVAANTLGAERLAAFMAEYRLDSLVELASVIQGRAERAVRDAIRRVPNGIYRSETRFSAAGQDLWVSARIVVGNDSILVDYAGCPPQSLRGGINCTMTVTRAETLFALKCLVLARHPGDGGMLPTVRGRGSRRQSAELQQAGLRGAAPAYHVAVRGHHLPRAQRGHAGRRAGLYGPAEPRRHLRHRGGRSGL